jgi:predicted MFS family arabinose efflux permease
MTIASVVGVPLSAWLSATVGWRQMFVIIGIATLTAAVLIGLFVKDRAGGERVRFGQLAGVLVQPATAAGIAVMVLMMAGVFCSYTMIAPVLHDRFGAGPEAVSAALMIFGIAGIVGNLLARRISQVWSADRGVMAALGTLILVFAALYYAPGWFPVAVGLLIAWALASDVFMPSQQRRMIELAPNLRGLVLALNSSALYVGMAVGSFTAGSLYPVFGLGSLPLASVVFLVLSLGALGLSRRTAAGQPAPHSCVAAE